MQMPRNRFRAALRAGQPQIGLWNSLPSAACVEVIAGAGYDWLLVDTEHSQVDLSLLHGQLMATMEHPLTSVVVRPPWNDMVQIKRYLDAGVQSLLIPYVQDETEALAALRSTRYPPEGVRGFAGSSRASRFGRIQGYHQQAHDQTCVLVQVETPEALERIEAIAAIDGVDGIFVGPGDLSAAMGHLGEPNHPAVTRAIDDALVRIRKAGKAPGIITADEQQARHYLELGTLFIAVGSDVGLLARGADALRRRFKPDA
jgi:4-hydroxy-2-oxoheptanedioate aldolase